MYFVDNNTGVPVMPPVKEVLSSTPLFFTEGGNGVPPTWPGPDWFNIIQSELINFLAAYGLNPEKSNLNQLQAAVEEAIRQKATESSALLTAIAALVTSANKMPYFTGKDKVAMTDLTDFARTLLGRSDAAGVLTDLGLEKCFTGNYSEQSGNRGNNIIYTNSFNTPLFCCISFIVGATNAAIDIYVNDLVIGRNSTTSAIGTRIPFSFIVPPGATYKANWSGANSSVASWSEMR